MKRATRFLISYRIYPRKSEHMVSQGYFSFHSKRYHKTSLGMVREIEKVFLLEEYGFNAETHYLEIINIKEQ